MFPRSGSLWRVHSTSHSSLYWELQYPISALYGFQSAVAPPLSGSAAAPADGTSSSSAAAAHDYLDDLDVTVAHMERRGALVPPKMDMDDDPAGGGKGDKW